MPVLAFLAALLALLALVLILVPFSLVQRYRVGTARRPARGWVATLNVAGFALSAAFLLAGAAFTSLWVPNAFAAVLAGLAAGGLLGLAGLRLTRWEPGAGSLHFTPNRALVLGLTLVVTARILYGFWRAWHAWRTTPPEDSWLAAAGVAGSLAAGAIVIGYSVAYWAGVRRQVRRHRQVTAPSARWGPSTRG